MSKIKFNKEKITKFIYSADRFISGALLILLPIIIFSFSKANIQTDSVDYYSILQRLTDSSKPPIVRNLHFVEQRSPGYSIISMIPYYFTSYAIEPFVKTEKIVDGGETELPRPPQLPEPNDENGKPKLGGLDGRPRGETSEKMGIPSTLLFARDIFFKNFYLERSGGVFEWKIIFALLLTSYAFLFLGILFSIKTLALERIKVIGVSLPLFVIFTSLIFIHNIINTPAYATLTAFGLSAIFCFFFVKSFEKENFANQFLAGLFLGFLVLTRLETVIVGGILFLFLIFYKKWRFLKNIILGGLPSLAILLFYNFSQFGTPFHFGILKGDINQLGFDFNYIVASLVNPKSGIVFWSFLLCLGVYGLFFGRKKHLKALSIASLIFIGFMLVRVPVMYKCMGGEPVNLGGIIVPCFQTMNEALMLIRSDVNRYITVLAPFAILGVQNLVIVFGKYFKINFDNDRQNVGRFNRRFNKIRSKKLIH
ncbi:MAG: ArnT family glycosyltransferase [Patescibacteria group bacterium]